MAKFAVVDEAPELKDGEMVIKFPDFHEEITEAARFAGNLGTRKLTSHFHLKAIVNNIVRKYETDPFFTTNIPYAQYEGVEFKNEKELNEKVLQRMLKKHYPSIYYKCLDTQIKNRPKNVQTLYFVGPQEDAKVFFDNGLDEAK